MGLQCMSCKKPLEVGCGKLFAEVYCCTSCYNNAARFMEKAKSDLNNLMLVLKDHVRTALLNGNLQVGVSAGQVLNKEQLLNILSNSTKPEHESK